ncbi:hypothetical protein [uncultured Tateyamaria sp.]|uniref:hypothetical protein n=1 Tax=uncultured Tateyamaria sp. TaxID=455651 RepID=UPI00260A0008|nr:hypothetical protein [uncultured Tateyamaria sp.]
MILGISLGFLVVFLASFWLAAEVGMLRHSPLQGTLAGLVGFVILSLVYLTALTLWARALLIAFLQTELPLILERLRLAIDQLLVLRETL